MAAVTAITIMYIVIFFITHADSGPSRSSPVEIIIDTDSSGRNDTQVQMTETYSPLSLSGLLNHTGKTTNRNVGQLLQHKQEQQKEINKQFKTTVPGNFQIARPTTAKLPGDAAEWSWQNWSEWTQCSNGKRIRTRSCIPPEGLASNNAVSGININNKNHPPLCSLLNNKETEKQLCFATGKTDDEHQNPLSNRGVVMSSNPYTVEQEIAISDLKRPTVNREPVKVIEIRRQL